MKHQPCYVRINEAERYVAAAGIEFKAFFEAISEKPCGLLMLKGYPMNAQFDAHTCLEYVSQEKMDAFMREDVYSFGDFCWADFKSEEDIQKLSDDEIAELLFASHMTRPLHMPFVDSLKNSYLYLAHDDAHWVKVYMRDTKAYKTVIEHIIRLELMGRKRHMSPLPNEMLDEIYCLLIDGGIFDFERKSLPTGSGVTIYPAKGVEFDIDDLHMELDRQRGIFKGGRFLGYNSRTKKWTLW